MHRLKTTLFGLLFVFSAAVQAATLPDGLNWVTNSEQPLFASPNAVQGGKYHIRLPSFPLTLRTVGPDSNGSFRRFLLDGNPSLLQMHPNTREYLPALADSWAFDDDNKTIYFKLNQQAKWSDGQPITADDFVFLFEFMASDHLKAPWYKDYFSNKIAGMTRYDDYTIAIHSKDPLARDELLIRLNTQPRPKHFYRGKVPKDYVKRFNWKPEPVSGPYRVSKVKKGKSIELVRVKDWWGYQNKYYRHRYNVDKIMIKVVRDEDIAIKHFEKGAFDTFGMVFPQLWHNKAKGRLYEQGFIQKAWLFNQTPQGAAGVWLNLKQPLFENANIRAGVAHSLNVAKMIQLALRGDYIHLQNFGSGYGDYDNQDIKAPEFDPALAANYFAKAGYSKLGADGIRVDDQGRRLSFQLTYLSKLHTPRVVVLKEEAKKAGLEIDLKLVDGAAGFKAILEKKFQAGFVAMGSSLLPVYWQYFHSENAKPQTNNFTSYSDKEMDNLIESFDKEFDPGKKVKLAHQIQQKISDCFCVIPTYSVPFARSAYWRYMKLPEGLGTALSSDLLDNYGIGYGLFWIDQIAKKETKAALKAGKTYNPVNLLDKRYLN